MQRSFWTSPLLMAVLTLTGVAAFARTAAADAIISTGSGLSGSTAADATPSIKSSYIAVGFTITAGSSYTFSDAIAYGIQSAGPPSGAGTTYSTGSLWTGTTGGPSTFVQNLTTSPSGASGTNLTLTFTPTSAITLAGGDTYWLLITTTRQQLRWDAASSAASGSGATYVQAGEGNLAGSASSPSIANYSAGSGTAAFEVDGTRLSSAPEPGSLALLGSVGGVVALGGWWRRRRQTGAGEPVALATGAPE